jgi:transmembrane sensor
MTTVNDIPGQAAAWLIRLEGQTTPQMWDDFQAWLETDRRHEAAFIRLRTAWTHCDRFKLLRPADGRVDRDLLAELPTQGSTHGAALPDLVESEDADPAAEAQHRIDRRRWLMFVGATAAATAGVGMLGWLSAEHRRWTYFETEVGGNRRAVLADRSLVLLNTDSRLRVRLANARRDSELIRGEAFFTVAYEKLRPFYVKAARTLVCAMGTAFSVRIHDDRSVEVLVAEGRVALGTTEPGSGSGEPVLADLAPQAATDQSVSASPNSLVIKQEAPGYVARKLAWTMGNISFDGETLTEAVREFNRYNRRHLAIADPAIAQMKVGGSFEATDPESFAATLEKHFGVRRMPAVRGDHDVIRLVSSDPRMTPRP